MGAALAVRDDDMGDGYDGFGGGGGSESSKGQGLGVLGGNGNGNLEDLDRSSTSWMSTLPDYSTSSLADDEAIRLSFDQPRFATSTNSTSVMENSLRPTGLFLHPELRPGNPGYLREVTEMTLIHAKCLVDRILSVLPGSSSSSDSNPSPYQHSNSLRLIPKLLDRLSDTLCLVIDMSELVRNVHPEGKWVREADRAYEVLGRFMNELNTNTGLYDVSEFSQFLLL